MQKLSVAIITLNEERDIGRCLESVRNLADEIVVVDSFSIDKTEAICLEYGARFIQHRFEGYIEQKNYALSQASFSYVLSLDADEVLSDELKASVLQAKSNFVADGYSMNRLTNYIGTWIHHCGWYPDTKLRLFNRDKGKWGGTNPHDEFLFNEKISIQHLKGDILHYSYHSLEDHYKQIEHFTNIASRAYFEKGKKAPLLKLIFSPVVRFIRDYFFLLGFLDGKAGFKICYLSAGATYKKYNKLRNIAKTIIISRTDSLGDVVLTLPMAGAIKRQNPDTRIIFLGSTYSKSIAETSEFIDEFVNFDDISKKTVKEQIAFFKTLKADAIIHVFPNQEIARLAKKSGIPIRIGTSHRIFHFSTCNRLLNLGRKNAELHEAQLNLKLLTPLYIKHDYNLNEIPELYGFTNYCELDDKLKKLLSGKRKNIILHPKSKGSAREWGLNNFSKLIDLIPANDFKIFITGTKDEGDLMSDFLKKHENKIIDLTGRLSLDELISFISKADALVATSTGPLHIAAAAGIKAIGIYAPMRPIHPGRWKPLGKNADYLVLNKECNDCKDGSICECILSISEEQVFKKLIN